MALTRRQKEILDFIESFLDARGYSPSFEEIASFFQYRSLATVHEHLSNLEAKGYIRKNYNESRSIELARTEMRLAAVDLPLLNRSGTATMSSSGRATPRTTPRW
jgi:repressor LexA